MKKYSKWYILSILFLLCLVTTSLTFSKYTTTLSKSITVNARKPKYTVNFYPNRLPEEYQEVEYIESTGTQWIDTGFNPNPKTTRVETTFQVTDNTKINQRLFGARKSYNDGKTICNIFWNSQQMRNAFRVDWVGNASTVSSKFSLNTDITIVSENNKVIINDLEEYTSTTSKSDSYLDFPIYINNFTSNGQLDDNQQPAYAKWKTFKIYDNGTLVRDFVPCYRKNDNEIGLYDIVNKVFYTNSGTGTFSKGNDVEYSLGTMSNQQFTYGTAQKLLPNTYTKEGYTFTGWNTEVDGSGTSYEDEEEVLNLSSKDEEEVNLYAQWKPNTYTVNFHFNRLPDGYQEVEYIESTGTQYIDTGYYASAKTRAIVEFSYTQSNGDTYSNGFVFGSANNGDGRPGVSIGINKNNFIFYRNSDISEAFHSPFVANTNVKYRMETYKNDIKINNTIYTSSMGLITQTSRYSSYLFARHQTNDKTNKGYACSILIGKIYFSQLYEDDILVRNFIPCYRKVDGIIGMYDTVNDIFYTNAGTGVFSKGNDVIATQQFTYGTAQNLTANTYTREGYKFTGWNTEADGSGTSYEDEEEVLNLSSTDGDEIDLYAQWEEINHYTVNFYSNTGRLPEEYQEVEYIESTGTQWIDTGFNPNPKTTRVETTFQVTDNTKINQRLFGARKSYNDGKTICNIFWNSQQMRNAFRVDWVGNASTVSSKFSLNTDITIVSENNKVIINDLEEYTSTTSKSDSYLDFPIYINNFTSNGQLDDNQQPAYAKWKTFKIYDNGTLVRDFVPCYRKNDNEIGLYDIVNKVFYTNSGTGTFSKGNDVEYSLGTMSNQQFTYGTAQKLLPNTYTKEGYTFTGWNTKPDGTGISYTDEQEVNNLTADNNGTVTLYAQWN